MKYNTQLLAFNNRTIFAIYFWNISNDGALQKNSNKTYIKIFAVLRTKHDWR